MSPNPNTPDAVMKKSNYSHENLYTISNLAMFTIRFIYYLIYNINKNLCMLIIF